MISSCPANNLDENLESLCNTTSSSFDLPVSNLDGNTAYKNVFCARCNNVSNHTYWTFFARCIDHYTASDILKNRSLMLEIIKRNCLWQFKAPRDNYSNLKRCLAIEDQCPIKRLVKAEPLLASLCSFYTFPVCLSAGRRNPHCQICNGSDISMYYCDCRHTKGPTPGPDSISSIEILFDFSSSSSRTLKVGDETTVVKNKACVAGFVFDPLTDKCIKVLTIRPPSSTNETNITFSCNSSGFVKIDISLVTLFPNGSVWIPPYKTMYSNESYIINGSVFFVCVNLTRNYTETTNLASEVTNITARQIITYVGWAISMISLILLLVIYICVSELRTLPGKNLICLSSTMLSYHTVFLLTGQTDRPSLCTAVSVLLHYFLLSSFCWMSVMAFDVAKTFGTKGNIYVDINYCIFVVFKG